MVWSDLATSIYIIQDFLFQSVFSVILSSQTEGNVRKLKGNQFGKINKSKLEHKPCRTRHRLAQKGIPRNKFKIPVEDTPDPSSGKKQRIQMPAPANRQKQDPEEEEPQKTNARPLLLQDWQNSQYDCVRDKSNFPDRKCLAKCGNFKNPNHCLSRTHRQKPIIWNNKYNTTCSKQQSNVPKFKPNYQKRQKNPMAPHSSQIQRLQLLCWCEGNRGSSKTSKVDTLTLKIQNP